MKLTPYLKNLDSLIAAIIGYYAIYLFTNYSGVGLSPDSIMYASTATNMQGHGSILTLRRRTGVLCFIQLMRTYAVLRARSAQNVARSGMPSNNNP